jgi:hypothetical protein
MSQQRCLPQCQPSSLAMSRQRYRSPAMSAYQNAFLDANRVSQ